MALNLRKKRLAFPSTEGSDKSYEALIRLWALRLLVPLGGSREFMASFGYQNDHLAHYLGLPPANEQFDMKIAMAELRKKHTQAERRRNSAALPETLPGTSHATAS